MPYTIVDVLDKFIEIEKKGNELYHEIALKENLTYQTQTLARVFAKEEERHIELLKEIKEALLDKEDIGIDFDVYDKASRILSSFGKREMDLQIEQIQDLLQFALELENEVLALAISVQGVLVRTLQDEKSTAYGVLWELIQEENRHIENLEKFLRK